MSATKGIVLFTGIFVFNYLTTKLIGTISSWQQAANNLLVTAQMGKWKFVEKKFQVSVNITLNNVDYNQTLKVLYPTFIITDAKDPSKKAIKATESTDDVLKTKIYKITPMEKVTIDPIVVELGFWELVKYLKPIIAASGSNFTALLTNITAAAMTGSIANIDATLLTNFLENSSTAINENFGGRLKTRVNGLQISYDFKLV